MLLFGFHSVTARLRQAPESIKTLYLDRDRGDARSRGLQEMAAQQSVAINLVSASRLDRLCFGKRHQGVVAMVEAVVPRLRWRSCSRTCRARTARRCCYCSTASPIRATWAPACGLPMALASRPS